MSSSGFGTMYNDGALFVLAATTLCCYEYVITFGDEMRCIWRRRISGASVLFLINRYAILAVSLTSIVQVLPPWYIKGPTFTEGPIGPYIELCKTSVRFADSCIIVINIVYAVFAALRIFALYGMKKYVFGFVLIAGLVNPCAQIVRSEMVFFRVWLTILKLLMSIEEVSIAPQLTPIGGSYASWRVNCEHSIASKRNEASALFLALRVHSLIFEGMLIALTWKKTMTRWSLQRPLVRAPFTTVLLRDGTLYFAVIAVTSALNLIGMVIVVAWYLNSGRVEYNLNVNDISLSMISPIVDALTSICMSRFILNLIAITLEDRNTSLLSTQRIASRIDVAFAKVARGFNADLHDTFLENDEEDEREAEMAVEAVDVVETEA